MSEIKGQLLGIIMTIAVFSIVAGILVGAFHKAADNTTNSILEEPEIVEVLPE